MKTRLYRIIAILVSISLLTHCGFKPVSTSLLYPFKSIAISGNNALWLQQVNHLFKTNNIKVVTQGPLKLTFSNFVISNSTSNLNDTGTSRTTTNTATVTATLYQSGQSIATRSFSTSLVKYGQTNQAFTSPPNHSTQLQLITGLLSQIPFWLASSDLKNAIKGHHAN